MNTESLKREMTLYGDLLVREYRNRLSSDKKDASGKLGRSFESSVTEFKRSTALYIKAYNYARVIDEGRGKGKTPPPFLRIADWIYDKGSFRLRDSRGRFVVKNVANVNRAAYAIAQAMGPKGFAGTNFLTLVYERIADKMGDDLAKAFGQDIEAEFKKILYKDKKIR